MRKWSFVLMLVCGCGRSGFDLLTDDADVVGDDADGAGSITDDAAPVDDAAAAAVDAMPITYQAAFANRTQTTPPTARRSSGAAVANDGRIWIFGGFNAGARADLAAFTPSTGAWATITAPGAPTARERHALAWDASNNRLVMFGGFSGSFPQTTHNDELYTFDPTTSTWATIPKAGTWPSARKDAAMVWIASQNQLLLYGGNNGSGGATRFGDLWLLSIAGTTATWTQLSPGGVAAPARSSACVGYDPVGRRLIVYGGETQDSADVNSTFQYLLQANAWQQDTTLGATPPGESFAQCAWDPDARRLVIHGGQNNGGAPIAGTHAYDPDAKRWDTLQLASGSGNPGARADGGAVYSAVIGGMFWFGGRTATTTYTNESWTLDLVP